MSVSAKRYMLPHVKKEHVESIKDKYMDLAVMNESNPYFMSQLTQLVKAMAVFIVKKEMTDE